ncbi:AraC family transcriptional regulator of adaptative response / DNA-3-methyladenine glycosylase II [Kribbella aluminosa]|uniref:AraC family transcriptional regulator of adaptative response / DNA-3-methyladenine glycosylase II n=1 Tax=Kribbella aluminosa TaxID=416017 RepID=A0ABS4UD57_9ACTN|nr:AlkA N-terminal domain-containing protein [Kribbella aluminosa]MBP2349563.1 AraC family transcriptional regulator of adaptative response / DNA-3-methyladenine glycosylase II [Kribbella aluminosa]
MTTYSAVRTTGIYCRPGCGAKPLAENVRTFELPAAAEAAGYRACLRCRPYRIVGTVPDAAPELVCRAVQLIIAGLLDDDGEAALGARLGLSVRQLRRLFHEHLGATPDQFARSRRAHFARRLLDDTELGIAEVAFASGFGSLRQFNRAMREIFRASPRELRDRRRRGDRLAADGGLVLRLPFTPPYDWDTMCTFLADRAIPGVESVEDGVYRRVISLDGEPGMLEIGPGGDDHLLLRAHLPFWEGVIHVADRAARLVGVDHDPMIARGQSAPVFGPEVAARPGLRVPGAWAPFEVAVQAVLRDRLPPADATDALHKLVEVHGTPVPGLTHGLTHAFPAPEALTSAHLIGTLATEVADGNIMLEPAAGLVRSLETVTSPPAAQEIALRLGDHSPAAVRQWLVSVT